MRLFNKLKTKKLNENLNVNKKRSYWFNFYSPVGNYENIIILPIIYIILLHGLISFYMSDGFNKIYGLVFSVIPIYIIIYDYIYKLKLKKSNNTAIDETNFIKSYDIFFKTTSTFVICIVCIVFFKIFFSLSDFISKLFFLPFLGCGLCTCGIILSTLFEKKKLRKIFFNGYTIIFLTYYFSFITFFTIKIAKQEGSYLYSLYTVPFWIIGFYLIYKYIIKNKY